MCVWHITLIFLFGYKYLLSNSCNEQSKPASIYIVLWVKFDYQASLRTLNIYLRKILFFKIEQTDKMKIGICGKSDSEANVSIAFHLTKITGNKKSYYRWMKWTLVMTLLLGNKLRRLPQGRNMKSHPLSKRWSTKGTEGWPWETPKGFTCIKSLSAQRRVPRLKISSRWCPGGLPFIKLGMLITTDPT